MQFIVIILIAYYLSRIKEVKLKSTGYLACKSAKTRNLMALISVDMILKLSMKGLMEATGIPLRSVLLTFRVLRKLSALTALRAIRIFWIVPS